MKIIAITGCPTGIAHTFMAQEALEEAGRQHGLQIKVETHGQIGVENELSEAEIREADAVIIGADKDVNAGRFAGKPCIEVSVSKAITDADKLVAMAVEGKLPIKQGKALKAENTTGVGSESFVHQIYKHLMNGVSNMIPFVVAGGVLTAISFFWGIYSADPSSVQYNVIAANLKNIGGISMNLMTPILAAFIAQSISDRPGMVSGFVGGMIAYTTGAGFLGGLVGGFFAGYLMLGLKKVFDFVPKSLEGLKAVFLLPLCGVCITGVVMTLCCTPLANLTTGLVDFVSQFTDSNPLILGLIIGCMSGFDMGGPFNKAAWLVGTALLAEGKFYVMAGVSAACITPPIMTGLATVLFRKYFDEEERNQGLVNFLLGATHITEGAIPFALKNPLVVLPIIMGSCSISASLTYLFKITDPAPHGGFLVLPLVSNPVLWLVAIFTGSLAGAVVFGMYRKFKYEKEQKGK